MRMRIVHNILGLFIAFSLMIILLFTSVEAIVYWMPGYFRYEYSKYDVTNDVSMNMDDLLDVSNQMMSYLHGDKENLSDITSTIDGQKNVSFFNEREIAHMVDVRNLFVGAIFLRRVLIGFILFSLIFMKCTGAKLRRTISKTMFIGSILFFALIAVLATVISTNFTRYFILFHHIFFRNDLWQLDPSTDRLINIVPEPFFMDTARNIGILYAVLVGLTFVLAWTVNRSNRKANKNIPHLLYFALTPHCSYISLKETPLVPCFRVRFNFKRRRKILTK